MTRLNAHAVAMIHLLAVAGLSAIVVTYVPGLVQRLLTDDMSTPAAETLFSMAIFGPLIIFALLGGAVSGVNALGLGEHPLALALVGATIGLAGVVITIVSASVAGTLTEGAASGGSATLLAWGAAVILVQVGAEEILFRGWLQPVLQRAWGLPIAIAVTALAFAGLHVMGGARSPVTLVNLFLGGVMFGILAAYGRGIAAAVAAHFAWNAVEQLGLGLDPNPGVGSFGALLDLEIAGARAWGGSDEGLNASIAMTVTLVLIVVPMALVLRRRLREQAKGPRLTLD